MKPLLVALLVASAAAAADWPQFRGPHANGAAAEKIAAVPANPKMIWETRIGAGFGAVSIASNRLYVVGANTTGRNGETLLCLDAVTGRELWRHDYAQQLDRSRSPACCTPAIVGGRVHVFGSGAVVLCLDAATGQVQWSRDLPAEINAAPTAYGYCASPCVAAGTVIVPVLTGAGRPQAAGGAYPYTGGVLIGFDAATGKEKWRLKEGCSPWSAPVAGMLNGQLTIVHLTGWSVLALEPATGRLLWSFDHKDPVRDQRCYSIASSPIIAGDMVIVPTHVPTRDLIGLRVRDNKPEAVWKGPRQSWYQTPALWNDLLLLPQGGACVTCADLNTGTVRWSTGDLAKAAGSTALPASKTDGEDDFAPQKGHAGDIHRPPGGGAGGTFTVVDGKLLLLDHRGDLVIAEFDGKGYRPLAQLPAINRPKTSWGPQTHPVFANGLLYCRNQTELVCYDLRR
jgi:outer membrane protein assembly factor BamB